MIVDTPIGRVGLAICADMIYRRVWDEYRDKVDVAIISAAWPDFACRLTGRAHWLFGHLGPLSGSIPAKVAADLGVPVVFANQVGHTGRSSPSWGRGSPRRSPIGSPARVAWRTACTARRRWRASSRKSGSPRSPSTRARGLAHGVLRSRRLPRPRLPIRHRLGRLPGPMGLRPGASPTHPDGGPRGGLKVGSGLENSPARPRPGRMGYACGESGSDRHPPSPGVLSRHPRSLPDHVRNRRRVRPDREAGVLGRSPARHDGRDRPSRAGRRAGPHRIGVALGARRLSIIDLAGGRQPLSNEDGSIWVAFNGELFEYPELRRELLSRGHDFSTRCDTEAWVHLYEDLGEGMFAKARGQFAVSLWDRNSRTLILGRDRVGICPLYYAERDGWLMWGSEIKALLSSGMVRAEADPMGIDHFFSFFCAGTTRTCFQGVKALRRGTSSTSATAESRSANTGTSTSPTRAKSGG